MAELEIVVASQQPPGITVFRQMDENRNPARVYLKTLSDGSRPAMAGALNAIADMMLAGATLDDVPWHRLRYEHTAWLRDRIINRKVKITRRNKKQLRKKDKKEKTQEKEEPKFQQQLATTSNKMLTALRQTLKQAWKLEQMTTDGYHHAVAIKNAEGDNFEEEGRMVSIGEMISLFAACNDGTKAGARDAAMFAVAYSAGMRRAEIAKLTLADYNEPEAKITVRKGKRNKTRTVPLPAGTIDALARWIAIRGTEPGALFPTIDKKDRIDPNLINFTAQSVQLAFDKRAGKAKVRKFTPHDLRRTYISNLLDSSGDLTTVQRLAGHSNVNTTSRYDRRGERAMFQAAKTLHVPFQRPTPD